MARSQSGDLGLAFSGPIDVDLLKSVSMCFTAGFSTSASWHDIEPSRRFIVGHMRRSVWVVFALLDMHVVLCVSDYAFVWGDSTSNSDLRLTT
jgi:hypothetical protein